MGAAEVDHRQGVLQGSNAMKIVEAAVILFMIFLIAYSLAGLFG